MEEILVLILEYRALCHGTCTDVCLDDIKFYLQRNWPICNSDDTQHNIVSEQANLPASS